MTTLRLTPVDTFFFKGQQTTVAGADTAMMGIFPPRPNTIYGALRSAYIHKHAAFNEFYDGANAEVKKWMGTPNELGEFHLDYCGLYFDGSLILPLPLDYQVIEKEENLLEAHPLTLCVDEAPSSQESTWRLMSPRREKSKSSSNQFVRLHQWKNSILNNRPIKRLISLSQILTVEPKVGIALDYDKRRTKEHYLYRINKMRFKKDGALLVYSSSCPDFSNIRFARIGGENRPWIIQQEQESIVFWNEQELVQLKEQILQSKIAKIILLSPAIWNRGSRPENFDGKLLTLPNGLQVEWLTAAIGRPSLFGGWDIAKHRPKRRCFMVPNGSVIYINVQEDQVDSLLDLANGFSFTDQGSKEGFGFAIIAAGKGY